MVAIMEGFVKLTGGLESLNVTTIETGAGHSGPF